MPSPKRPTIERLKNWRRVTPTVSSSGGTHSTGASSTLTGSASCRRASTAARSTSRPVTGTSTSSRATDPRSRLAVSWLSTPTALPVSRRRAAANSRMPASTTRTSAPTPRTVAVPMARIDGVITLSRRSEVEEEAGVPREHEVLARAAEERADHHQHGPRHDEDGEGRDGELAVLGLVGGVAVRVGSEDQADQAQAGQHHAGDHGLGGARPLEQVRRDAAGGLAGRCLLGGGTPDALARAGLGGGRVPATLGRLGP